MTERREVEGAAVVLGDVMLDVRAALNEDFSEAIDNYAAAPSEVTFTLAGTGVGMARALGAYFASVHLLAALGTDTGTDLLTRLLDEEPFDLRLTRKETERLGVALILRDGHSDETHGRRLVAVQPGANQALSVADVAAASDLLDSARLVCVDGYGLLAEPRRAATLQAMRTARTAGGDVFVDLVPHDLFRHWDTRAAQRLVEDATVVASSGATLAHLVGHDWPDMRPLDADAALAVAERTTNVLGERTYLIHFGTGHCSQTLAYRDGVLWWADSDYPTIPPDDLAGFGDRLNARELARLLADSPAAVGAGERRARSERTTR